MKNTSQKFADNSLNFVRLIAALNVFYNHCTRHLSIETCDAVNKIVGCFDGVPIFFILSGFLLWHSIEKTDSLKTYCNKRILRLYPELWGGVLINFITMLLLYRKEIEWFPFIAFTIAQATIFQFWTPDSLRGYGVGTPNGALWTICPMVQCYIVLWILNKILHKKSFARWLYVLGIGIVLNITMPLLEPFYPNEIIFKLSMQTFLPYMWLFVLGAIIYEYFEKLIVVLMKFCFLFFLISSFFAITKFDAGEYGTLKCIFLAFAVIGFAYRCNNIKIRHDISYEFYLYHMIVINVMVQLGIMHNVVFFFVAAILTLLLSYLSYWTIGLIARKKKEAMVKAAGI